MQNRTDLATEAVDSGRHICEWEADGVRLYRVSLDEAEAARWGKPSGEYLTATLPPLTDDEAFLETAAKRLGEELRRLLPPEGTVLVVGLGNEQITPDALGPRTASGIMATRHIPEELARSVGLSGLRPCAVITPGVLGNTGLESSEVVTGVCRVMRPAAVIAVDALAARQPERLGCTVQFSDTGIAPGSGVGNNRRALTAETLGVPVIGLGVPTVTDAALVGGRAMMVTPREIDLLIDRASRLLAMTVHAALQPDYSPLELLAVAR